MERGQLMGEMKLYTILYKEIENYRLCLIFSETYLYLKCSLPSLVCLFL